MTARGGFCRRRVARSRNTVSLAPSWTRTTPGASAASRPRRVASAAIRKSSPVLTTALRRGSSGACGVELGDEVVGVAAIVALGEFNGTAVAQEAAALEQQAGRAARPAQQPRPLRREQHGPQALQRAHRPRAMLVERLIERL